VWLSSFLLQTLSTQQNLSDHPHYIITICFGRSPGSGYSSSSSSSDEPNFRVIDLPTLRRLNSPRCATCGSAYTQGSQAASERANLPAAATVQAIKDEKQKTGGLRLRSPLRAMLTIGDSQKISSQLQDKTRLPTQRKALYEGFMHFINGRSFVPFTGITFGNSSTASRNMDSDLLLHGWHMD
jgi:hypothetical protein